MEVPDSLVETVGLDVAVDGQGKVTGEKVGEALEGCFGFALAIPGPQIRRISAMCTATMAPSVLRSRVRCTKSPPFSQAPRITRQ
ncbi:MAG: hypothetical protein M3P26_04155 [Gemmatimonadota bacterium]|nr:hypothetical protein [Gemmatimonadota bacterium]